MKLSKRFVSIFFVISLAIIAGSGYFILSDPQSLALYHRSASGVISPFVPLITATPTTKLPPTRIRFSTLQKEIPVQAALVRGNQWDMFDVTAAWLSTSAVPGEGNVVVYAHNWVNLFGDLYKLKVGDPIEVEQQGQWKVYVVTESRAVGPKDIDAILSDKNQLTLYTCEGSFDQKRRVVYAIPQE